jgi:hypothetical protein
MKESPIEYIAKRIRKEEPPYDLPIIKELLIRAYRGLDGGAIWMDYPEYFKEYQAELLFGENGEWLARSDTYD